MSALLSTRCALTHTENEWSGDTHPRTFVLEYLIFVLDGMKNCSPSLLTCPLFLHG